MKDVEISGPSAPSVREETKVEDVEKTVAQTYMVQARVNLGVDPNHFFYLPSPLSSHWMGSTICYKLQTSKGIDDFPYYVFVALCIVVIVVLLIFKIIICGYSGITDIRAFFVLTRARTFKKS